MRDIELSFTLTEAEFLEASKQRSASPEGSGYRLLLSLLFLVVAIYATWFIADAISPPEMATPEPLLKRVILGVAPWLFVLAWFYYIVKWGAKGDLRAAWKSSPLSRMPRVVRIADAGLTFTTAFGTEQIQWGGFLRLVETPNLFLLYPAARSFVTLPKRAFPDGTDFADLRRSIAARINPFGLSPDALAASLTNEPSPPLLPQLQFRLTLADFAMAERADGRKRAARAVWDYVIWPVVFAAAYLLLGWITQRTVFAGEVSPLWVFITTFIAFIVIQTSLRSRRWRKTTYLRGQQTLEVNEQGLTFRNADGSQWVGWGAIVQHQRAKNVFVLHLRDGTIRIVPLRAFLQPQYATELQRLLQERVIPSAGFAVIGNATA